MNIWFDLYWTFFCIGGLTFGGGYAMLPMLEREIVERHHWSTSEELLDYYAVGQCTPGIIAVNVATIIGYQQKGLRGAALRTKASSMYRSEMGETQNPRPVRKAV